MKQSNLILTLTFDFSRQVIGLNKSLAEQKEFVISKQLLKSAASIGADAEETGTAQTKKNIMKMSIAPKEARETRYWLKLLDKSQLATADYTPYLVQVEHIVNILTKIVKTSRESLLKT
jgi:four helix bundle protein